jgi:hypothetical protein
MEDIAVIVTMTVEGTVELSETVLWQLRNPAIAIYILDHNHPHLLLFRLNWSHNPQSLLLTFKPSKVWRSSTT